MRRKLNIKQSIIAIFSAVILAFSFVVQASAVSSTSEIGVGGNYDLDGEAEAIFAELCRADGAESLAEWVETSLAPRAGDGVEWYIIALRQAHPEVDLSVYANVLETRMQSGEIKGAVARQRCALALTACGRGDSTTVSSVMDETIGGLGLMSYIFGLNLMNSGIASHTRTSDDVIDAILAARLEGGGWAIIGHVAEADVTAMAVQALAPYRERRTDVKEATDTAIELLISDMRDSGTYISYGTENPESAAQAAMAFVSCGIDPEYDSRMEGRRTLIDGIFAFRLAGEGFSHTAGGGYNATATVQSLLALIAVSRARRGIGGMYVFDTESELTGTAESVGTDITDTIFANSMAATVESVTTAAEDSLRSHADGEKIKFWIVTGIVAAAVVAAVCFYVRGWRHKKNFVFIVFTAVAAVMLVLLADIRTANDYYAGTTSIDGDVPRIGVSISIRCDEALGVVELESLPTDGVILNETVIDIAYDGTVLDALTEAARVYRLQLEYSGGGSMAYVSGIEYLYEFDGGELSGWIYRVNGEAPSVGCGGYKLSDGDVIEWEYTLVPKY